MLNVLIFLLGCAIGLTPVVILSAIKVANKEKEKTESFDRLIEDKIIDSKLKKLEEDNGELWSAVCSLAKGMGVPHNGDIVEDINKYFEVREYK